MALVLAGGHTWDKPFWLFISFPGTTPPLWRLLAEGA